MVKTTEERQDSALLRDQIRRNFRGADMVEGEQNVTSAVYDAVQKHRGGLVSLLQSLESIESTETSQWRRTASGVAYPDEERLEDTTGLAHTSNKLKKLQRKAGAIVEEEDVPDTANTLLQLKSQ